jgi:hypothetical protein
MFYTLYNKRLNKKLTHPKVGVWFTNNLDEAKDMLKSCKGYLTSCNLTALELDFVIINAETEEEILL